MFFKKKLVFFLAFSLFLASNFFSEENNDTRPIVDMVSVTQVSTDKFKITWKNPKGSSIQNILIYRDTKPIISEKNIKSSKPVAVLPKSSVSYIDTVNSYKEYYYAVIIKTENSKIYDIILPSINATAKGISLKKPEEEPIFTDMEPKTYENGVLREVPLPYIDFIPDFSEKRGFFSDKAKAEAELLAGEYKNTKKEKLAPYYFDEDIVSPSGGDEYYLFEILKTYFVKKDYKSSVEAFNDFLRVNRSDETTNRTVFYLGQAHYFLGNYRTALTMFLYTEEFFPVLSKKWINSTLDFYKIPESFAE